MGGAVERRAKDVLGAADAVMANSSAVAGLLRRRRRAGAPAPSCSTAPPASGATVEPADDYLPGEPLVLTVGYLIERKGIRDLIAAVGRLRRGGRRVHLADRRRRPAARRARGAGRGRGRRRHRPLPRPRAARARARAHGARRTCSPCPAGTRPSGSSTPRRWRRARRSSPARAKAPRTSSTDGVSGYLVPVRDPSALAGIIAEVLDDPAKAAAVGEAGKAAALELSWERNARLTLGVYEKVLRRGALKGRSMRFDTFLEAAARTPPGDRPPGLLGQRPRHHPRPLGRGRARCSPSTPTRAPSACARGSPPAWSAPTRAQDEEAFISLPRGARPAPAARAVLFPTHDQYIWPISRHAERLEPWYLIPFSRWETMQRLHDKREQLETALARRRRHAEDGVRRLRRRPRARRRGDRLPGDLQAGRVAGLQDALPPARARDRLARRAAARLRQGATTAAR